MDNKIFVETVYALAKEKNIKIKELENQLGFSIGYLKSIARKTEIVPSADLIIEASNILNVSMEYLIGNNKKHELLNDESLLVEYLEQLCLLTKANEVVWEKEPWKMTLRKCYIDHGCLIIESINPRLQCIVEDEEIYVSYKGINETGRDRIVNETYQTIIPGTDKIITVVMTSYECREEGMSFSAHSILCDIFLGKTEIQDIMVGSDWIDKKDTCVFLGAQKLLESIQEQIKMRDSFLTNDVRKEIMEQLQFFKKPKNDGY